MKYRRIILTAIVIFICVLIAGIVYASGAISLTKWIFAGGGGQIGNNGVEINAAFGQPITGGSKNEDNGIFLGAGFFNPKDQYRVFLPQLIASP